MCRVDISHLEVPAGLVQGLCGEASQVWTSKPNLKEETTTNQYVLCLEI